MVEITIKSEAVAKLYAESMEKVVDGKNVSSMIDGDSVHILCNDEYAPTLHWYDLDPLYCKIDSLKTTDQPEEQPQQVDNSDVVVVNGVVGIAVPIQNWNPIYLGKELSGFGELYQYYLDIIENEYTIRSVNHYPNPFYYGRRVLLFNHIPEFLKDATQMDLYKGIQVESRTVLIYQPLRKCVDEAITRIYSDKYNSAPEKKQAKKTPATKK